MWGSTPMLVVVWAPDTWNRGVQHLSMVWLKPCQSGLQLPAVTLLCVWPGCEGPAPCCPNGLWSTWETVCLRHAGWCCVRAGCVGVLCTCWLRWCTANSIRAIAGQLSWHVLSGDYCAFVGCAGALFRQLCNCVLRLLMHRSSR